MKRAVIGPVLLVVLLSTEYQGCICDPNKPGEHGFCDLLELLTWMAYGTEPAPYTEPGPCLRQLPCRSPSCVRVEENGSFKADRDFPIGWYGDSTAVNILARCDGITALKFVATSPSGPSASRSAQAYQIIDYHTHIPRDAQPDFRRVRAQAGFTVTWPEFFAPNRQFGLRIDAYSGDPDTFPRSGDPEDFPIETATYRRLATEETTIIIDDEDTDWHPLTTELLLPEATDFIVILAEAYENVENIIDDEEFIGHYVDYVQVAIDEGPLPPEAGPDRFWTTVDRPITVNPLSNDWYRTAYLDRNSLEVRRPPLFGTAEVLTDGFLLYTPDEGFIGMDSLSYTVADQDGLVSNEAEIYIDVRWINRAPVANDDHYELPPGGLLIVPSAIGVLANDTDADGDTLTAVLETDPSYGTLSLDPTGAFTYSAGPDFPASDSFTYRASDGVALSNIATVTISRSENRPPIARDVAQLTSYQTAVAIDVLANDEDPDGDPIAIGSVGTPQNGTAEILSFPEINFHRIRYTPDAGFLGVDSFTYTAVDDKGAESNEATVTVTVNPRYDLEIIAQSSVEESQVGVEMFFNLLVGNRGGSVAEGVEAVSELPPGFTYTRHEAFDGSFDPDTGVWTIGDWPCCQYARFRIYATPDSAGTFTYIGRITAGLEWDFNADNNADSVMVVVVE